MQKHNTRDYISSGIEYLTLATQMYRGEISEEEFNERTEEIIAEVESSDYGDVSLLLTVVGVVAAKAITTIEELNPGIDSRPFLQSLALGDFPDNKDN